MKLSILLPDNQNKAVNMIFKSLSKAAKTFKANTAKVPTLFIDGSDVLCKFESSLFNHLLYQAKELANAEVMTIVFVSSEGSIVPILQQSSTSSRSSKIIKIADIPDSIAVNELTKGGLSNYLSNKVVGYAGGRFVYLRKWKILYKMYRKVYPGISDDVIYEYIKHDIYAKQLNDQQHEIEITKPISQQLLMKLTKQGEITPSYLHKKTQQEEITSHCEHLAEW